MSETVSLPSASRGAWVDIVGLRCHVKWPFHVLSSHDPASSSPRTASSLTLLSQRISSISQPTLIKMTTSITVETLIKMTQVSGSIHQPSNPLRSNRPIRAWRLSLIWGFLYKLLAWWKVWSFVKLHRWDQGHCDKLSADEFLFLSFHEASTQTFSPPCLAIPKHIQNKN